MGCRDISIRSLFFMYTLPPPQRMSERIAVIGLGYVGLPVAVAFARKFPHTIGFDINATRVQELADGHDRTDEVEDAALQASSLRVTDNAEDIADATFYVVTVPTPIDGDRRPDLTPIISASRTIGPLLKAGDVVVYESTVYPGVTEEVCGPILQELSGLQCGSDFTLGYSPERINPGDKVNRLETITKVVSGQDDATLERIATVYGKIIDAGIYRAASIQVAEAAKVIENTQRDINIALMNELAMIFDRLDIRTSDVLEAAGTKWNFLKFTPGLVGGHCIGVDPYYLTSRAESVGYHPQIILSGRRINDGMGAFIARKAIKMMATSDTHIHGARVGVFGLTFKENCPDLRNSRVPDIIEELKEFNVDVLVHDPLADANEAREIYNVDLSDLDQMTDLDVIILAVAHRDYDEMSPTTWCERLRGNGNFIDVKSRFTPTDFKSRCVYWSL